MDINDKLFLAEYKMIFDKNIPFQELSYCLNKVLGKAEAISSNKGSLYHEYKNLIIIARDNEFLIAAPSYEGLLKKEVVNKLYKEANLGNVIRFGLSFSFNVTDLVLESSDVDVSSVVNMYSTINYKEKIEETEYSITESYFYDNLEDSVYKKEIVSAENKSLDLDEIFLKLETLLRHIDNRKLRFTKGNDNVK